MKRRTLLASLLAVVAPVRAAFVSKSPDSSKGQGSENKMTPYDAVKAVYDGFDPVEGFVLEFDVHTKFLQNYARFSCKKILALTGKHEGELWVILEERFWGPTYARAIKLLRSLPQQDDFSGEKLRTLCEFSGKRVISRALQNSNCFEMNKLSRVPWKDNSLNWHEQEIEFQIVSRFFQLS